MVLMACLVNACAEPFQPKWHMINVNHERQGDAHLIVDGSINLLVDAGRPEAAITKLVPYLRKHKISTIHHLIISHPHTDHYGGLDVLLDAGTQIDNIYYSLPPDGVEDWNYKKEKFMASIGHAEKLGATAFDIGEGFSIKLPNSKVTVLYAYKKRQMNKQRVGINDYSLILAWDTKYHRTLFAGDLETLIGAELAKQTKFKADILKIPHHGVGPIAPTSFLDAVQAKFLMFPSTRELWWHPRGDEYREWVAKANIPYCHNGFNGHVVLTYSQNISVQSEKATHHCQNTILEL